MNKPFRITVLASVIAATVSLSGCFTLAATGVAVGVMAVLDRRTIGTQTEDQGIELKAMNNLRAELRSAGGISVTSFNRKVLLTGQVADEQVKMSAGAVVNKIDNVRSVHNELEIAGRTSLTTTATDSTITARVKAAFVDAKDLQTNAFKVVTEAGQVYLMGLVSRREGDRAAQVASRVSGVQKVVTVFEYISEDEAQRLDQTRGRDGSSAPPTPPGPARP